MKHYLSDQTAGVANRKLIFILCISTELPFLTTCIHTHTHTVRTIIALVPTKKMETHSQCLCLLKEGREKVVICSTASLRRFPIVNRSGGTAPFPFIPLLEARCLCFTEDRTTSLPATLHRSNTWELPLA